VLGANGFPTSRAAFRREGIRAGPATGLSSTSSQGWAAPAIAALPFYLTAYRLGRALYAPLFGSPAQPASPAQFLFLDPAAERFYTA
jgi:hypothetical protein